MQVSMAEMVFFLPSLPWEKVRFNFMEAFSFVYIYQLELI